MKRYASVGGLAALFLGLAAAKPSLPVAYCASINTGETDVNFSIYQSEGLCYDLCNGGGYALGVLQSSNCWCANYAPANTVSTSECQSSCPGYPDDYCGGDNTYGYIKLNAAISGTKGAVPSEAPSTYISTSTSTPDELSTPAPSVVTVTETLAQISVITSPSSSDQTTTSTTSLTSEKSAPPAKLTAASEEPTTTPIPEITSGSNLDDLRPTIVTSVKTVTSNGQIIYQTIISGTNPVPGSGNGMSGGSIAGLVIGILAILAAFIAGALVYRRHRQNRKHAEAASPLPGGMAHSRGSSAVMMSKGTTFSTMSSSGYGMAMEDDLYGSRRVSMKPMDPRLDPKQTFGLYRAASHDSINTLRDDHDYSRRVHQPGRVLRVTNMHPTDNDP